MTFFVYVLHSQAFDKIYIGYSADLEKRIQSHNTLATKGWTLRYRPWVVIYSEQVADKKAALAREKQLKSAAGRRFIRSLISQT